MVIFYTNVDVEKRILTFYIKNYKNILLELNEDYLDHIKNQEEAIIEKILNK